MFTFYNKYITDKTNVNIIVLQAVMYVSRQKSLPRPRHDILMPRLDLVSVLSLLPCLDSRHRNL